MAKRKKSKRGTRSIVIGHLEKVSSKVFLDYRQVITDLIKGRQGIYALYKNDRLYYVGLASNLRNRIKGHLNDRHQGKWTHFSIYILRKTDYLRETEALVLRIADPTGNYQKGKLKRSINLRPELKRLLVEDVKKSLDELLGHKAKSGPEEKKTPVKKKKGGKSESDKPLKGIFPGGKCLYARYKGIDYKAWVYAGGTIKFNGNLYKSPSEAGFAVRKQSTNGWWFWKYKDRSGNLVRLREVRK